MPAWGGFEGWSNLVRNALVWAGLPDPGETRELLVAQADEETVLLRQLLDAWSELDRPVTVAEAINIAEAGDAPLLHALLEDLPRNKHGKKGALGNLLRDYRGRVLDGRKLDRTDQKRPKWQVVGLDAAEPKSQAAAPKPVVDLPEMPDVPHATT